MSSPAQPPASQPQPAARRPAVGRLARGYAAVAVWLRYPIILGWLAAVALAFLYLPQLVTSGGGLNLVPRGTAAARAERDAVALFGAPLGAPAAVVQHSSHLPLATQVRAGRAALAVDRRQAKPIPGLLGALPVTNAGGIFPGSRQHSTTVITFLYFRPSTSPAAQTAAAHTYARRYASARGDHLAGVTGPVPARQVQGQIINRRLRWVEGATLLVIALIVGLYFRAVGAPLVTLACAGAAYFLAVRVVAWAGHRMGLTVPPDLEPVLVVLQLGVTTDYAVFFLSGMRSRLAAGLPRLQAARLTTAEYAPIIGTAGLVVAASTASLAVAKMQLLRAFGPGLALTVLTALIVSMTLMPAFIAIGGGWLFRPGPAWLRHAGVHRNGTDRVTEPGQRRWRTRLARRGAWIGTARPVALVIVAVSVAALLAAAWGARNLRVGSQLIRELPATAGPARAEAAASQGFVPGIMAPTDVLVIGRGVAGQTAALGRLQRSLARQPDVAGVVGPASLPAVGRRLHLITAKSGNAVRYGVISRTDPLGPVAIGRVRALRRALPSLGRSAGLTGVRYEVGGETALTADSIDATVASGRRVAVVVLIVILVLLAIFLRALLAPLYLLAASVLALLASLGLTVWIFQGLLGYGGLAYYVPFAVAVLLVSLGSDYNIFVVGRIWEEARRRPLREAVAVAAPRASRAITTAGLTLAGSFGLLALIPLEQFREMAFAMAAGVLIDTFVVRSLVVPALVALFGRVGQWPGGRRAAREHEHGARTAPDAPPGRQPGTAGDVPLGHDRA